MKYLWIGIYLAVFIWSGNAPKDRLTWFLEVAPAIVGAMLLAATHRSFRFTSLVYILILIHCLILMVGGHYTYAEVPFFEYLKPVFGFTRNNYDKLGHFVQGFGPAMVAREILIRRRAVNGKAWLNLFIVSFCLALSACYELIEWGTAEAIGQDAHAFLGTQGYVWDTQSDMALALVGAIAALVLLGRWHDRQLHRMKTNKTI